MILINIAVFIILIGLGIFSYGVNQKSLLDQHSIAGTVVEEKKSSELSDIKSEEKSQITPDPLADTSTKFDELTATILVLEEDISQKKRDIEDLSNQRKLITSEIEVLTNEKDDLQGKVTDLDVKISNMQTEVKENSDQIKIIEDFEEMEKATKTAAKLLGENEELRTRIEEKENKIVELQLEASKISKNEHAESTAESMRIRIESLTEQLEKLQEKSLVNEENQLASDKLIKAQKKQISDIRASNLELKKQVEEVETNWENLSKYNGLIATFEGNLVYEPNKKKIILVSSEGIEFTILQDDFPGDLVAKCGLPVSSSSEDRCFATIVAQVLIEDDNLVLKGRTIKEITKK